MEIITATCVPRVCAACYDEHEKALEAGEWPREVAEAEPGTWACSYHAQSEEQTR